MLSVILKWIFCPILQTAGFFGVTSWAPYVLVYCASISSAFKKKERLKEMPLYFLEVLGGFNCAAACSVCSNPQTSCSKEFNHELVRMMWCMWCLKYLDILVSREEKQILWKTEAGELMSKDEWKVKASLIHGRRRELDHYHKGTTKLGSIGLMSNSIARRVKNYLNNIYIVIY